MCTLIEDRKEWSIKLISYRKIKDEYCVYKNSTYKLTIVFKTWLIWLGFVGQLTFGGQKLRTINVIHFHVHFLIGIIFCSYGPLAINRHVICGIGVGIYEATSLERSKKGSFQHSDPSIGMLEEEQIQASSLPTWSMPCLSFKVVESTLALGIPVPVSELFPFLYETSPFSEANEGF